MRLLLLLASFARTLALQSPVHHDAANGRGGHLSAFKGLVHDSMHLKGAGSGAKKEGRGLKVAPSGSESSGKHDVAKASGAAAKAPALASSKLASAPSSAKVPKAAPAKTSERAASAAKAPEPAAAVQRRQGVKPGRKAPGAKQGALINNEDDVAFVGLQPQALLQGSSNAAHETKAVEADEKTVVVPHAWLFFKPTAKIAKVVQCLSGIMCVMLICSLCMGQRSPLHLLWSRGKGQPRELDGLLWRARPSSAAAEPKQL